MGYQTIWHGSSRFVQSSSLDLRDSQIKRPKVMVDPVDLDHHHYKMSLCLVGRLIMNFYCSIDSSISES